MENERLTIRVDADIKQQAKVKALANRTTLSRVIEDYLHSYVGSMKGAPRKNGKVK